MPPKFQNSPIKNIHSAVAKVIQIVPPIKAHLSPLAMDNLISPNNIANRGQISKAHIGLKRKLKLFA